MDSASLNYLLLQCSLLRPNQPIEADFRLCLCYSGHQSRLRSPFRLSLSYGQCFPFNPINQSRTLSFSLRLSNSRRPSFELWFLYTLLIAASLTVIVLAITMRAATAVEATWNTLRFTSAYILLLGGRGVRSS